MRSLAGVKGNILWYLLLPEAFIFALMQRRSRKIKTAFHLHLPFS